MKRALITGGAGFIGSHLAEHLLGLGYQVCVIDDLSTGSVRNVESFKNHLRFTMIADSCENRALMAEKVDEADEIYHLAAAVGVKLIVQDSARTIHLNYTLTEVILEMVAKKKKPLLFTSTSEVYGKSDQIPYMEDGDLLLGSSTRWRWAYACSKLLDEFMVLSAYSTRGVPAVICRLFNTVGPRQTGQYGMVVPTLVGQTLRGEPLTVYGDGTQSRCFLHVKDVVPLFPRLLAEPRARGNIFNIGSDREIRILDLAELIKKELGSSSPIRLVPYEEAYNKGFEDMMRRVPSTRKVRELLGFSPGYSLEQTIRDVAADLSAASAS